MVLHEVEIKAVIALESEAADVDDETEIARGKLIGAGCEPTGIVDQSDIYLSHPCRDFAETDEAFRIRIHQDEGSTTVSITYKGPKVSERSKARLEKEIDLGTIDPLGLLEVYSHLGFEKVLTVKKTREYYSLKDMEVVLDRIPGLGLFVEAEILSENIDQAEDRLLELLGRLGWNRQERRSYLELLLEKQV